ncbi:MAG: hypothetical protein WDM88_10995 [Galbitalea sp.]
MFLGGVDTIVATSTKTLLGSDGASTRRASSAGSTANFSKPGEGQIIAVVTPSGHVAVSSCRAASSAGCGAAHARSSPPHDLGLEEPAVQRGQRAGARLVRLWHIIEARNSASGQVVLSGLTLVLIAGVIALVVGFGIAAWIVSGVALRPVSRMREQASRLSQSSTADMLPVGARARRAVRARGPRSTSSSPRCGRRRTASGRWSRMRAMSCAPRSPCCAPQLQLAHLSTGDAAALEKEISAAESTSTVSPTHDQPVDTLADRAGELVPQAAREVILSEFLGCMDRAIVARFLARGFRRLHDDHPDSDFRVSIVPRISRAWSTTLVVNAIAAASRGSAVKANLALERAGSC